MELLQGGATPVVAAAGPGTRMLTWGAVDGSRLEAVRVVLGDRGMRAAGTIVAAADDVLEAYSASYSLATDETGVVSRLTVRSTMARGDQHVTLSRSEEGDWLVDTGDGTRRNDFDGALDADLAFSPLFNALPVRRVGLHRAERACDLSVVYVDLPSLRVEMVRQSYRSVSVGEQPVVAFAGDGVSADLVLDAEGLVLDYPGLARRI